MKTTTLSVAVDHFKLLSQRLNLTKNIVINMWGWPYRWRDSNLVPYEFRSDS